MEITDILKQMKEADNRTEKLKEAKKPNKSKLTNKQQYLKGLLK